MSQVVSGYVDPRIIKERIAIWMAGYGLDQKTAARSLGVNYDTFNVAYSKGRLSRPLAVKIQRRWRVPMDWQYGLTDYLPPELVERFYRLPNPVRKEDEPRPPRPSRRRASRPPNRANP